MRNPVTALGFFVAPVRSDAVLRRAVHVTGADLHLQRLALRPDDRGVQGLVHPEPGLGDVVLEPPGHGLPQRVHHPDGRVAVADGVAQDPDADQVVDVVEVAALDDHLLVDRPVVLGPSLDRRTDLHGVQRRADVGADLGQIGVPRRGAIGHQPDDLVVALGMQDGEGQILQFPLDRRHAEPMCQRRNDFQGLGGFADLLLRRQEPHRAHVVQTVGHLDDQHPWVAGHRDDHLADGLGLGGRAQHDLVEFGDPVDEMADLIAEFGGQRLQGVPGVLDGVVQQRGDQGGGVHAQLGQDVGHRQRVGDVRVAGPAELGGVSLLGNLVGALQKRQIGLGIDLPVHRDQRFEHRVDRAALGRHSTRQAGPHPP